MRSLFGLILLAFPLVEIYALVQLAHTLGWWLAVWLALTFVTGLALIRQAGAALLFELISSLMTPLGRVPAPLRSHRMLFAGFLLLFPGVVSDFLALAMLLFGREVFPRYAMQPSRSRTIEGQFRRHH